MRIASLDVHPVAVSRAYATQIAQEGGGAREQVAKSRFLFVEAVTDCGRTGWGEISDVPPAEYPDLHELREQLSKLLIGRDPFVPCAHRKLHPAKFAVITGHVHREFWPGRLLLPDCPAR